ncbi:hypothetical protein BGZ63DRAFT_394540 [Mariannaea sp. PMI_226]|nr:hypothetical protein BGZ63DRAFT_394540 [Mariannaea sp. PMI_226]
MKPVRLACSEALWLVCAGLLPIHIAFAAVFTVSTVSRRMVLPLSAFISLPKVRYQVINEVELAWSRLDESERTMTLARALVV